MIELLIQVLSIVARLLFIMVLLMIIGEPLSSLLRRCFRSFDNLDVPQELVLNAYLGGLVIYVLALIPFRLFNPAVLATILAFCLAFTLARLATKLRREGISLPRGLRSSHLEQVAVLALFLIALIIQVIPLTKLKLGSIHDTSLHALFVQLILENSQIPATHQPYLPAAIIFPQGAHVVFAFAALLLGITPPLAVFHVTALLNAMTVLAAYHFGKVLDERKYAGLSMAFVFAFVSMWPMHITWGGNTFIAGIPLFLITATLLKEASNLRGAFKKREVLFFIIVGLFLGYLAATHLAPFLTLVSAWIIFLLARIRTNWKEVLKEFGNVSISIVTSIAMILPFFVRFVSYYHLPGQNVGLPADVVPPTASLIPLARLPPTLADVGDFLLTMPNQYNISPYLPTRLITIALAILLPLNLIVGALRKSRLTFAESFASALCVASIILFFIRPFGLLEPGRYSLILYISLMLLLGSFNAWLYTAILNKVPTNARTRMKGLTLILPIFVSIYAPFVYYRIAEDPWRLTTMYRIFAVTTDDDYNLMLWMKDNLPQDSIILINPFEPGLFIPALSQKKVVYPLSAYHLSISYGRIVSLLARDTLNSEVFRYLQTQNITHVFVGSKSSPLLKVLRGEEARTKWDPYLFLGNPNFKLVKKMGNAFLFRFCFTDPRVVLADSFEYTDLDQGGWQVIARGDGKGDAIITSSNAFDGSNSLMLCARSESGPFWCSVLRKVHVADNFNVTLSFYLRTATGFGPEDALMLIISDTKWDKQLYFTTNPRVPVKYKPVHLPSPAGYFEFNLSRLWDDLHGEQLPKSFFIQILSYDVDGVENVAYVDALGIGIGRSHLFTNCSASFTYKFALSDDPLYEWKFSERGSGTGFVKAVKEDVLQISARRADGWYWSSVYTVVRTSFWKAEDVTLSFYINVAEGFGPSDALMVIISDPSWKKQIYFSTNTEVPVPVRPYGLDSKEGYFSFPLSKIWLDIYGEPLPNNFLLQILNYDRDGVENVAYIGSLRIDVN